MTGRPIIAAAIGVVLLTAQSAAQTCTVGLPAGTCTAATTASLTIGNVLQLTLSTTTTSLSAPTRTGYASGYMPTAGGDAGPSATVKSNAAWHLTIAAAAATWTATNTVPGVSARANKPAGDLKWATTSGGTYTSLTTSGATVASAGATAGTVTNIFFRTLYNSTVDTPGQYSLGVVFTVSAP